MKSSHIKSVHLLTILITGVLLWTSCTNSTSSDDHDEHEEPFGVALYMNGEEIAAQEDGEVSYNEGNHLELEAGQETDLITVRFIAEDGDRFEPDGEYSLQWEIDNDDVLEVEQHEEDGPWAFHLVGLSAGDASVQFVLWHDSHGHGDFTSKWFEVHVSEETTTEVSE